MDKKRSLRNLRYSTRKKGYVFSKDRQVAVMPADSAKRSRRQELRLISLGVCVQYNMFANQNDKNL